MNALFVLRNKKNCNHHHVAQNLRKILSRSVSTVGNLGSSPLDDATLRSQAVTATTRYYNTTAATNYILFRHSQHHSNYTQKGRIAVRYMSDNLLGYNPMASQVTTNKNTPTTEQKPNQPIIGVDSNTAGGGVWAQTSAKRDKLGELRMEHLNFEKGLFTLDDLACEASGEKSDLWLMDGLKTVWTTIDDGSAFVGMEHYLSSSSEVGEEGDAVGEKAAKEDGSQQVLNELLQQEYRLPVVRGFESILKLSEETILQQQQQSTLQDIELTREEFERHITNLQEQLVQLKAEYYPELLEEEKMATESKTTKDAPLSSSTSSPPSITPSPLHHLRDFFPYEQAQETSSSSTDELPSTLQTELTDPITKPFQQCQDYFASCLLESTLDFLHPSSSSTTTTQTSKPSMWSKLKSTFSSDPTTFWDEYSLMSDSDIDRAAIAAQQNNSSTEDEMKTIQTISLVKVHNLLRALYSPPSSSNNTSFERVKALWNILDHDNDGLLDQNEMNQVVYWYLTIAEQALLNVVTKSLEISPLRPTPEQQKQLLEALGTNTDSTTSSENTDKKKVSWLQNRKQMKKEEKAKQTILKFLQRTIEKHFEIEVETPHRLRCIYAWAEKQHQDGKLQSVLLDTTSKSFATTTGGSDGGGILGGGGGSKRYVELDPKISLSEFREIQEEHFPHLDRACGEELCNSLKEDLLVHQGKGRQNQELKRETLAFIAVVSLVDLGIIWN